MRRCFAAAIAVRLLVGCGSEAEEAHPMQESDVIDEIDTTDELDATDGTDPLPDDCTAGTNDGDSVNNRPNWSACDSAQVCVFAGVSDVDADGAPLFTCVTPTPAPPIDPGLHIRSGWAAFEVESARCNNGDLARFWFRPAHDAEGQPVETDDWLVFLKGGGVCVADSACAARWFTSPFFVAPPMTRDWTPNDKGIFRTVDNAFSGVHQVYVHYCTSDSFRGSGSRSANTGLYHDGHLVVEEVVGALTEGLEFRLTEDGTPRTFTLTGDSRPDLQRRLRRGHGCRAEFGLGGGAARYRGRGATRQPMVPPSAADPLPLGSAGLPGLLGRILRRRHR